MLRRLLQALITQKTDGSFTHGVVVADNDPAKSADPVVSELARSSPVAIHYVSQPVKNIALTRNASVATAAGDYIAILDDDEFPDADWLMQHLAALERHGAAGVLGPVRPHFDSPPPSWIIRGRFCERPEPPTGSVIPGLKCRTGNVLFRRELILDNPQPFDPAFPNGGEDVDFFVRMNARGHTFVWCNEAPVHESVPPDRWTRRYMLRRAMLRGKNSLKVAERRAANLATSLIAVPLYTLVLPFTLLGGQHVFMKYMIRFCDHFGRLTAVVGLNPVSER